MRSRVIAIVLVCLFYAVTVFGQSVLESESEIVFSENEAVARLAVQSERAVKNAAARLELLDAGGAVRLLGGGTRDIAAGKQMLEFRLPMGDLTHHQNEDLAWYRLRYRVADATGIVSVSQIAKELFELRIIAASNIMSGMGYRVRIRAVNPFTEAPAAGVQVETTLELDKPNGDLQINEYKATGVTDAEGFAVMDFAIPAELVLGEDGEVRVVGRRNGLVREADEDLQPLEDDVQFLMMTDKPIYQPEQMLNIRGIVFKGGESKTILADAELEFRIEDEDDTLLYREKLRSSGFGVAAIAWRIPANAKLGDYSIEVLDAEGEIVGFNRVKVSRYDLPNFVVTAKPSKPYYLPGDKEAEIEVRADYLFGKPVTKGKVRVVEETSREWNYKEQKYDIEEGSVREGELDAEGKFTAKFDLGEAIEDFEDDDWRKHRDVRYAAYLTDLTTNKTEQRRFDIRLSREPIHVYFIEARDDYHPALPMTIYVSTFYADGSPAECDVEIKASEDDEEKYKMVARTKTNSYGAGKFVMNRPKIGDPDDDLDFAVIAKDATGKRGTISDEDVSFDEDEAAMTIATDKAIYKPGETVNVSLRSTIKTGMAYVDVVNGWTVIDSRFVRLADGMAELSIPYSDAFKGQLTIAAFTEDPEDDDDLIEASRGIIFPAMQGINVETSFDKAVYKPNEEATVKVGVVDAIGQAIESALGIVILDKAVEERARTDSEFGMFRELGSWLGYGKSFGGVNVKDLNDLDLTKPISDEMQLVAEVMLHDSYYYPNLFHSNSYFDQAKSVFGLAIQKQLSPVEKALSDVYRNRNFLHPTDDASLRNILSMYGVNLDEFRDPWGVGYRVAYSTEKNMNTVTITSAGPDKAFDTRDDFTAFNASFDYFKPMGLAIDTAVKNYHTRTGDFVRDEKTLLAALGVRELPDRFGRPYKIICEGDGRWLQMTLRSTGKDGKFEERYYLGDDFQVWSNRQDYFAPVETRISNTQRTAKDIPMTEAEFRSQLNAAGITDQMLTDANGKPLYVNAVKTSRYWDKVTTETVQVYGETKRTEKRIITPVTQEIIQFTIRSFGKDGKIGTYDDVTFMQVVHVLSEQTKDDKQPVSVNQKISFVRNTGAIAGTVTDPNGAVVPNATVTATGETTGLVRTTTTDESGKFLIAVLPAGTYSVRVAANGFKDSVMSSIPVNVNATATVNVFLSAGSVSEVVTVSAGDVETMTSQSSSVVTSQQIASLPLNTSNALKLVGVQPGISVVTKSGDERSTPRLREYFPETLLWRPEVITNSDGKAEVKFRMADNITTWKMYTIASTKNGKVGFAEKEVTAFQSFFVDLDPPKFLTEGDEIFLPTQVRNYTEKKQRVGVTMSTADWFSFIGCENVGTRAPLPANAGTRAPLPAGVACDTNGQKQGIDVASGQSENAVFGFKAIMPIKDGKQRVTAKAETDSDAIERPVTVRPDGREIVATESRYFNGSTRFDLNFPANALPRTQKAELKIYPNLMAHVAESVEGLLQRPYGCGEQTISSTYPNVMILKFAGTGERRRIGAETERTARKYLQDGYDRLVGYQVADGGFSYWGGKDESDFALTAYALRFLADASAFIAVDPSVVEKAENFLIAQQRADGSWNRKYRWETVADETRAKSLTTYIARTLAMIRAAKSEPGAIATGSTVPATAKQDAKSVPPALAGGETSHTKSAAALTKALGYLRLRNSQIDDPYSLALLGLALNDAGDTELAAVIADKLVTLGLDEAGGTYWNLESNTVFNGWGTAGRIETTALVTQLLMKLNRLDGETQGKGKYESLVAKAMIFLLKNKDRYGVWYSTQTTINVLDAFVTSVGTDASEASQTVDVILNGETIRNVEIGPDKLDQIVVELNGKLTDSANTVELRGGSGALMAQLVANHYIGWQDADQSGRTVNQSRALSFDYKCDRTDAAIMQEIACSVSTERVGFRGYGMLLAEIGTPPGAEVSHESLQAAMENDWSISKYEVLPDRIRIYMWAKAGGTKINFKFRPRYGINAQTPASVVYDYYNPEAQAVNAPIRFMVK